MHSRHEKDGEDKHSGAHNRKHRAKDENHKKDKKTDAKKGKEPNKAIAKKAEESVGEPQVSPEAEQEKRAEVVERSLKLKRLYEEAPVPRDPQVLARLLVAEHILALNTQIKTPADPKTPIDKKALLVAFDSMGELADKLENPEIESTPEIQDAYEEVMQLAENTLLEDAPTETIIEANTASAHNFDPQNDTPVPAESEILNHLAPAPPVAAMALIGFLLKRRKRNKNTPPTTPLFTAMLPAPLTDFDGGGTSPTPRAQSPIPPRAPQSVHLSSSLSPAEARAAYHENARADHLAPVRLRSPDRLASLALVSAFAALHKNHSQPAPSETYLYSPKPQQPSHSAYPTRSPQPTETSPISNGSYTELTSISRSQAAPAAQYANAFRPPSGKAASPNHAPVYSSPLETHSSPVAAHSAETTPVTRKIEHMPLHTLLAMAETIPIGYGQRLRKAYEKGQIDKEGLIKILKSRSKNKDYIKEYRQQVTRRKNLVAASPEFLKSTPTTNTSPTDSADSHVSGATPQEPKIMPFLPSDLQDALSSTPTPPPVTGFNNPPPASIPWLLIIGITVLVLGAGILIFFLVLG